MDPNDDLEPRAGKLPRVLGPVEALSLIVGSVIGSGIFIVPARVARDIPAISGIMAAWIIGGLFSLAGALTLAELGAMLPHAGGPYVYLRKAFGPIVAFLFGWTEFLVIRSGSVATLAAAFALYFVQLVPAPASVHPQIWLTIVACSAMALVATINALGTKLGGGVHVVGTVLKVGALFAMLVLPFVVGQADPSRLTPMFPAQLDRKFVEGFMAAMVAVLWTYDGWVNVSSMAEEIKDPGRNIPRALTLGMTALIAIYLMMTLAYHLVISMPEMTAAASAEGGSPKVVAAVFCQRLFGAPGLVTISLVVMCSIFIALNGNAMSGPRAYFAMARDGLFPRSLCAIHPKFQTPLNAIVAQAVWAIGLTLVGTTAIVSTPPDDSSNVPSFVLRAWRTLHAKPLYDVLYGYVIFGGTVIYTMTIASVFVLRRKFPELERPYRTWGYPLTPLLYIAASLYFMSTMLSSSPSESFAGIGIILLGLPAFLLFTTPRSR